MEDNQEYYFASQKSIDEEEEEEDFEMRQPRDGLAGTLKGRNLPNIGLYGFNERQPRKNGETSGDILIGQSLLGDFSKQKLAEIDDF